MGLVKSLLLAPLAPVRGVIWVAEQLGEEADRRLYDPGEIRRQLDDLGMALESGEIDEEEYDRAEQMLLERLAAPSNPHGREVHDG